MKIGIASDHRGYKLKEETKKYLIQKHYEVIDYGTASEEKVDYVDYAEKLCKSFYKEHLDFGILICGTGIGMSISANKIKGIMCAKINNVEEAFYSKAHNNANVISLGSKINIKEVQDIIDKYIDTDFIKEERHIRRIEKIKKLENSSNID